MVSYTVQHTAGRGAILWGRGDIAMKTRLLRHAKEAMAEARTCQANMSSARSFDDFGKHWRVWLRSVQRIWNKLEGACHSHPRFQTIKRDHTHLERQDPLLKYIKVARDVDEHSVREISTASVSQMIRGAVPGTLHVESLRIVDGRITEYKGSPIIVHQVGVFALLSVENRGMRVDPPVQHKGIPITPPTPQQVASLAMIYFEELLARTERECGE